MYNIKTTVEKSTLPNDKLSTLWVLCKLITRFHYHLALLRVILFMTHWVLKLVRMNCKHQGLVLSKIHTIWYQLVLVTRLFPQQISALLRLTCKRSQIEPCHTDNSFSVIFQLESSHYKVLQTSKFHLILYVSLWESIRGKTENSLSLA